MTALFIDSSYSLIVGVYDFNKGWLAYERSDKKVSQHIHRMIFDLLNKTDRQIGQVTKIFYISGVGSYTGIRVAHGLAQVAQKMGLQAHGFYHHLVEEYLTGDSNWSCSAFKNEFLTYSTKTGLALVPSVIESKMSFEQSGDLIKNKAAELFEFIIKRNISLKPLYFRTLEQEYALQ